MKNELLYRLSFVAGIFLSGLFSVQAQLQVPGKPMGESYRIKGAYEIYLLPPPDPLEIDAIIQRNRETLMKTLEFAIERRLDLTPGIHGTWSQEDGYRVWRVHVISPGAYSLGLIFSEFHLREEVKLMVYDPGMEHIKGAYSTLNNKPYGIFAVGHLPGDEVVIELQVPPHVDDFGRLTLGSLSHAFLDPGERTACKYCSGEFGCSQDCEIDINCVEGADWQTEKKSVVRIHTPTQYCTGILINNTADNGDRLLLTAKHCIDKPSIAYESVFEYHYESPSCFGEDGSLALSTQGSEILAVGDSIDFCLVRLSESPPHTFDLYFAGWDLTSGQTSATTIIHHPEGDVKKISKDFDAPTATSNPGDIPPYFSYYLPFSFWRIKQWDIGSTEPGSSGSPLFNANKQVIGLLSFGSAECGDSIGYNAENDRVIYNKAVNINDYFTRLNVAWDHDKDADQSLRPWLDPINTGQSSLGGRTPTSAKPALAPGGEQFRLYPNPVGNSLFFTGPSGQDGQAVFRVYDLNGALLMAGKGDLPGPVRIDAGGFNQGVYLLYIQTGGVNEVHKFVVTE